ncbi:MULTISPECIES: CpsB/CapC family capsule biosynthesis tyrosine phosphatase [unclassified Butyrivibrio]|uniref:CpsB/CapC family capsule biosynthesis tyrosine phosphatase n=1 Tax=unclassified Butyrivibrio TaxID=2639466 RepID=UPI000429C83F|nr:MULTISPECIES: CpsB/CapC family capsule biosynthesis tyrosine phosphatase [unclassified Butyrivibrio]
MIDFHTHILPGIDDGSKDMNMTKKMIRMELEQGVDRIVFTPHFYADNDDLARFLSRRRESYEQLVESLSEDTDFEEIDISEFKLGAEVLYFPGIGSSRCLTDLCVEDTRVLLLEMPFRKWTRDVYGEVRDIVEKQHLTVVLVHIERFRHYQKDLSVWNEVLELPVISQVNTECFLSWKSRRFAYKFIKEGHDILLGTDAHNVSSRPVNMAEGRTALKKKFGEGILTEIDQLSDKLWRNDES